MSKLVQLKKGTETAYVKSRTLLYEGNATTGNTIDLLDNIFKYNFVIVYTGTSGSTAVDTFSGGLIGAVGSHKEIFCVKQWSSGNGPENTQLHFCTLHASNNGKQITIASNWYYYLDNHGQNNYIFVKKIYGVM